MYFLLAHYYSVKAIISSEVFFSLPDVMHASVTDFFFCLNSCDQCVPSLCHIRPLKQCVLIQQKVRKLNTGSKFPTSIFNRIILKNVFGLFLYAYSLGKNKDFIHRLFYKNQQKDLWDNIRLLPFSEYKTTWNILSIEELEAKYFATTFSFQFFLFKKSH